MTVVDFHGVIRRADGTPPRAMMTGGGYFLLPSRGPAAEPNKRNG